MCFIEHLYKSIILINNKINYISKITLASERKCVVEIIENQFFEKRPYRFHMIVTPTKINHRYECFLEKVTEISFDKTTPIICEHS